MQALGMIEVIGLPPAIEAADSALKAANVALLAIEKVSSGILTVEITGDVGAVTAAVDAGAAAAERVGTLRAKHVIPYVDESLEGKVLIKGIKLFQPKNKPVIPLSQSVNSEFSNSQEDGTEKEDKDGLPTVVSKDSAPTMQKFDSGNRENETENVGFHTISAENTESNTMTKEKETIKSYKDTDNGEVNTLKTEPIKTYTTTELRKKSNDTLRAILQSQGVELTESHKSAKKEELIQLIIAQQNRR
ncbi:BMC domain-containing protein [Anaerocolumna sp.]|uniref:BMC domain-containing protein n=1 Tax=Anaerocolumna sp. TaxID=2041569 RepID=UPI0028AD4965|nr:BMC domain-containing protein [Anaerocolumna sp.]